MITYKIHLIRHGMTEANERGLYAGRRTDVPLCAEGRARLQALQEHCGYPQAQLVYTSPLARCRETAELLYPEQYIVEADGLAECDFGEFDGKELAVLKEDARFLAWVGSKDGAPPPGGEGAQAFEARVSAALEEIFADLMKRRATSCAVVTHGGIIALLLAKYAQGAERDMHRWMVEDGCGWTILMTPQMWMRDGGFEVYEKLPYRADAFLRLGPGKFKEELARWKREKEEEASNGWAD